MKTFHTSLCYTTDTLHCTKYTRDGQKVSFPIFPPKIVILCDEKVDITFLKWEEAVKLVLWKSIVFYLCFCTLNIKLPLANSSIYEIRGVIQSVLKC